MGAIKPHTTKVDTESKWDGAKAIADAPNDAKILRYMHAWVDDEGDPEAKSSYKFPHHQPKLDAPANIAAVNNALARLSQADIPEADRDGVEKHLRKHRIDAGLEEGRMMERREIGASELRANIADGIPATIEGYAAVFNQWSEDIGGFQEIILPGAFKKALDNGDDVRALINHDMNMILGRRSTGTLELWEDEVGLKVKIILPDTQYAKDLVTMMQRGDVNQMSFGFTVEFDRWYEEDGNQKREIVSVAKLFDVSVVTFPAYPQTIAVARDVLMARMAGAALIQEDGTPVKENQEPLQEQALLEVKKKRLKLLELGGLK